MHSSMGFILGTFILVVAYLPKEKKNNNCYMHNVVFFRKEKEEEKEENYCDVIGYRYRD